MIGRFACALALLALIAFSIPTHGQTPATLAPQTNRDGGVTVTVRPLISTADSWRLEIVMDTHSVALTQDLVANTVLIDDQGNEHKPSAWEGEPPGGHHRKGTLTFEKISNVSAVRVEIRDVGVPNRRFSWQLTQ